MDAEWQNSSAGQAAKNQPPADPLLGYCHRSARLRLVLIGYIRGRTRTRQSRALRGLRCLYGGSARGVSLPTTFTGLYKDYYDLPVPQTL